MSRKGPYGRGAGRGTSADKGTGATRGSGRSTRSDRRGLRNGDARDAHAAGPSGFSISNIPSFGFAEGGLSRIFLVMAVLFVGIVLRLVVLQVVDGPKYAGMAEQRRKNVQVLQAKRGTIYDRNGNVLAMSEECYDVYCNPNEVTDVSAEADLLAEWLGGEASEYAQLMRTDSTFVYLKKQADKEPCESLRAQIIQNGQSGVYLLPQTRRVYPYGSVAGQLLGMVSLNANDEYEGITGLESQYNNQLAGKDGEMIMETGLQGIPIAGAAANVTEPIDGDDLVLSIDIDVQQFVEEQLPKAIKAAKATSGMCMICDPNTGEIIAACSTPFADLTQPETIQNEALNLKLVSSSYDPGSTFKVLTAAIGLESGKVSTNTQLVVPPSILVGYSYVHDDDARAVDQSMDLREVLRRSSNVGAAMYAQEVIGAETFAAGVEAFGIGSPTGIDFPGETAGIVKSLNEYDGSTLGSMSFGQGLTIPMVQMVRAVSAIANGGTLPTPHFVTSVAGKSVEVQEGPRVISQTTASQVADMMKTVVDDGTAVKAKIDGYDLAAKTGTGEQALNGYYQPDKYLASLIGFAPVHEPKLLAYVGLNETPQLAYSSAAPAFSVIMGEALKDMGVLANPQGL